MSELRARKEETSAWLIFSFFFHLKVKLTSGWIESLWNHPNQDIKLSSFSPGSFPGSNFVACPRPPAQRWAETRWRKSRSPARATPLSQHLFIPKSCVSEMDSFMTWKIIAICEIYHIYPHFKYCYPIIQHLIGSNLMNIIDVMPGRRLRTTNLI